MQHQEGGRDDERERIVGVQQGTRGTEMTGQWQWMSRCRRGGQRTGLGGAYIHCQNGVNPLDMCGCEAGTSTCAQYCIEQDWLLLPIPAGVSYDHAGMACCGIGPTFGAMQTIGVGAFETVLVTGAGPVGPLWLQNPWKSKPLRLREPA